MKKTKKRIILISALILMIAAVSAVIFKRGHFYDLEVYPSGVGWGYDILVDRKPYIHQPYIPAIEGEVPFRDKESARKTGRLVIRKIKNHQIPMVTMDEVEKITGIQVN